MRFILTVLTLIIVSTSYARLEEASRQSGGSKSVNQSVKLSEIDVEAEAAKCIKILSARPNANLYHPSIEKTCLIFLLGIGPRAQLSPAMKEKIKKATAPFEEQALLKTKTPPTSQSAELIDGAIDH